MTKLILGGIPRFDNKTDFITLPDDTYDETSKWSKGLVAAHEIGHWQDSRTANYEKITDNATPRKVLQNELNAWIATISRGVMTDEDKDYLRQLATEAEVDGIDENEFINMLHKAQNRILKDE